VPVDSRVDVVERTPLDDGRRGRPSRGVRSVTAVLPNGRVVWLRIDRPLAPAAAARDLSQLAGQTGRWRRAGTGLQRYAIKRLANTIAADTEQITAAHLERAHSLRRRIVAAHNAIDRKLSKAAEKYRVLVARQLQIERETVRRLGRRDLWDKLVILSSFPLFAAYGQTGRPFGANNIALTLALLVWLAGDEVVDAVFGSEKASPYPLRDTDAWSYIAPLGNLLAGWWLLGKSQHEPFVAGRVKIGPEPSKVTEKADPAGPQLVCEYTVRVDLSDSIATAHFADFKTFIGVPAVATLAGVSASVAGSAGGVRIDAVSAKVEQGVLIITLIAVAVDPRPSPADPIPTLFESVEVAWMVDTRQPSTDTSST